MIERERSQVQAYEMRFLLRIKGVTQFNKMGSSEIQNPLNIKPLLPWIEQSQLGWFGHVSKMPQERLSKQALLAKANGRKPVGRPRTRWTNCIEDLGWNRLGLHWSEMMDVIEDREVWRLNLELLSPKPHGKAGNEERRRRLNKDKKLKISRRFSWRQWRMEKILQSVQFNCALTSYFQCFTTIISEELKCN